jgi:class 3 adenylate cyclase
MSLRILTPRTRPVQKCPRWVSITFLVAVAAALMGSLPPFGVMQIVACVAGLLAAVPFAIWVEERLFAALSGRAGWLRLLASWALLPLGGAGVVVAVVLCGKLSGRVDGLGALVPPVCFAGAWFILAAAGTAVVVTIDVAVSAVVSGFRARIAAAVLSLVGLVLLGCSALAVSAMAAVEVARRGELRGKVRVDGAGEGVEKLRGFVDGALDWVVANPMVVAVGVFGLAFLAAFPALLSACGKLAEAVMERLHPMSAAMDEVSRGARDVRLEEGGSRDFVQLAVRFNRMVESLALAERMERAFGMYVSGHVMERIRAQHGEAMLPPSLRDATVFFADIRGFTQMSERLPPETMVAVLNRYFDRVVAVVAEHHGYLNKFIGDAVVVVFNGPIDQPDHAERALRCALALQRAVVEMNEGGAFPEWPGGLGVGVGVATGPMVCGNVGGAGQMEYTVIGDTVNLASRLTGAAGAGECWANQAAIGNLPTDLRAEPLAPLQVKGKRDAVVPWRVAQGVVTSVSSEAAAFARVP